MFERTPYKKFEQARSRKNVGVSSRFFSFEIFTPALAWGGLAALVWFGLTFASRGYFIPWEGIIAWAFVTTVVAFGKYLYALWLERGKGRGL